MMKYMTLSVMLVACGGAIAVSPTQDGGSDSGTSVEAGVDAGTDGTTFVQRDASFADTNDVPDSDSDSGMDAGQDAGCALDGCDCPWLALNCSFYPEKYTCGVSAACAQTYDVDLTTCIRTVHTVTTDGGTCALHDDGVTWCCP
jgi:hypothetical protein